MVYCVFRRVLRCAVLPRLPRPEADTLGAELRGAGCGGVHLSLVFENDLDVFKTGGAHGADQFCILQSAGNSTGPQGDIFPLIRRQRAATENVADVKPSARLEEARPLP